MIKLIGVLLLSAFAASVGARGAERGLEVVSDGGRPVAQFSIGDSRCELRDDQIQCRRVER
jgi:hypothetical protein